MNKKQIVRCIAFLLVLGAVFWQIQGIFGLDSERARTNLIAFLDEKPGSLDAVYIGSSNVFCYWQPATGWADQGIAVWNYAIDHLPPSSVYYLLREARRTQPDALYIINLNSFRANEVDAGMENNHRVIDYMPFSLNKVEMINTLSDAEDRSLWDRLEYFFPIVRFHSRWDSLETWSFGILDNSLKCSIILDKFLEKTFDNSVHYTTSEAYSESPEEMVLLLNRLLDYCDQAQVNVLFVNVPQRLNSRKAGIMNTLEKIVSDRGYPVLDALNEYEHYDLDLSLDFFDVGHTNIHGSLKYMAYLEAYLQEHYDFTDKRGTQGWESWDQAAEDYTAVIGRYALPFEISHARRDNTLDAPALSRPVVEEQTVRLDWSAVDGAQSYEVYRKSEPENNACWHLVGETDGDTLSWTDSDLSGDTSYTYTVVPCRTAGDVRVHGKFSYTGVEAKTAA